MALIIDIIDGFTLLPNSYSNKSAVVIPPTITGDDEAYTGDDIILTASGSVSAFGTAIEYTWILPDGSTTVGATLNFHIPEDAEPHSIIQIQCFAKDTFDNESSRTLKSITAYDINMPVINGVAWNNSDHFENHSYVMTIDATDPNGLNIAYEVICNDASVNIVQRSGAEEHVFDITYGEYVDDTGLTYTITITNTNILTDFQDNLITVHETTPIINNISWDNNDHWENNAYVLTIDAIDPQALDLTYEVECNDGSIGIVQRSSPNEHIFDITYGEYEVNTNLTYTITITNTETLTNFDNVEIIVHDANPVINSVTWNDSDHWENNAYVMTIDATDPQSQALTYGVICNDGNVGIAQQGTTNIFDITYGEYVGDANLTYTITVTNVDLLTDVGDELIAVRDANPAINNISWNDNNHIENNAYVLTIEAVDPQSLDLTYGVTCDDLTVGIVQRGVTNVFDITYGEYVINTDLIYTITVTNTDTLTDVETEEIVVHDTSPVINNISWDSDYHIEGESFILTIDATDPQALDLTYEVECNDGTVDIIQRVGIENHVFDITYGAYVGDANVEYTITATNTDTLTDVETEPILVHHEAEAPIINSISWDNNDHWENNAYVLTIGATDPNNLNITYEIICDDSSVIIVQRGGAEEHIFDITYGEYAVDVNLTYTISITNTDSLTDTEIESIIVHDANPVINSVAWNDSDHWENESYVMTIDATDPQSQTLTYGVICNDGNVGIVQQGITNVFDITYGEYAVDTDVTFTITVTNVDLLTDVEDELITVHDNNPIINNISWDNSNQFENNPYVMTIDAIDPNALDLTYGVTCDDLTVGIVQRGVTNVFDITYGEYVGDANIEYTITITNTNALTDVETEPMLVHHEAEAPIINSISWDDYNHLENISYEMTIGASDPNGLDLTYGVVCDDASVGIAQQGTTNIFDITYGEYVGDTDLIYTIIVTNTDTLTDVETESITVHNVIKAPIINNIAWNDSDHWENESYVMTIDATDPQSQTLTYEVTCDDVSVVIAQQGTTNVFDITYGEYAGDTALLYTITVTNTAMLIDIETESITVQDTVITGDRGVFGGGWTGNYVPHDTIDYIAISINGNAIDFGNLANPRRVTAATSNGTNERGIFAGGFNQSGSTAICTDTIDYITISVLGNAADFGNLTQPMNFMGATSNGTGDRGIFSGGNSDCSYASIAIIYVTIPTGGNALSFGTSTIARYDPAGTSNGINDRGIFAGGRMQNDQILATIDYITISNTGNASGFGSLSFARKGAKGISNGVNDRGLFTGGWCSSPDVIDYITISTTGNAAYFGDLSIIKSYHSASSNGINDRGVTGGGRDINEVHLNIIDYVTISTTGNALDFGDLTIGRENLAATSDG